MTARDPHDRPCEPGEDMWEWAMNLPITHTKRVAAPPPPPDLAESPIEAAMYYALLNCGLDSVHAPKVLALATIHQQYPIETEHGTLRADMAAVRHVGKRSVLLAIETDGHDFHQLNKQQVERDYRRGRAMARAGWIVVRFTGSEVTRNARACALEVCGIIIEAVDRIEGRR